MAAPDLERRARRLARMARAQVDGLGGVVEHAPRRVEVAQPHDRVGQMHVRELAGAERSPDAQRAAA